MARLPASFEEVHRVAWQRSADGLMVGFTAVRNGRPTNNELPMTPELIKRFNNLLERALPSEQNFWPRDRCEMAQDTGKAGRLLAPGTMGTARDPARSFAGTTRVAVSSWRLSLTRSANPYLHFHCGSSLTGFIKAVDAHGP
jgi:hypothetical protein